jgi:DNA replicative helicase MCM subunit Mcm2 (Cdc46/Mcm family)
MTGDFHHCRLVTLARNWRLPPLSLFYSKDTSINHPTSTTFESMHMEALELAASNALYTLLYDLRKDNDDDDEEEEDSTAAAEQQKATNNHKKKKENRLAIQILLKGNLTHTPLRSIKSEHMHRLIKCPGIVISAAPLRCRAIQLAVRCPRCLDCQTVMATDVSFGSVVLFPNRCQGPEPVVPIPTRSFPMNLIFAIDKP